MDNMIFLTDHMLHPLFSKAVDTVLSSKTKGQYLSAITFTQLCKRRYDKISGENTHTFIRDVLDLCTSIRNSSGFVYNKEEQKRSIIEIQNRLINEVYFDTTASDDIKTLLITIASLEEDLACVINHSVNQEKI